MRIPVCMHDLPTVAEVTRALRAVRTGLKGRGRRWATVTLRVMPSGAWALHEDGPIFGSPEVFFQATGAVPSGRFDARGVATAMLAQCADTALLYEASQEWEAKL